jgi:hypothetical protein
MNWFALTLIAIWISASIATCISRDSSCMGAAMVTTIVMGFGWLIWKGTVSLP